MVRSLGFLLTSYIPDLELKSQQHRNTNRGREYKAPTDSPKVCFVVKGPGKEQLCKAENIENNCSTPAKYYRKICGLPHLHACHQKLVGSQGLHPWETVWGTPIPSPEQCQTRSSRELRLPSLLVSNEVLLEATMGSLHFHSHMAVMRYPFCSPFRECPRGTSEKSGLSPLRSVDVASPAILSVETKWEARAPIPLCSKRNSPAQVST